MTGAQFLQATVFGWLQHPCATRQELHQALGQTGLDMSAQGFEQRFDERAVLFLRTMVEQAVQQVFEVDTLCPILSRFQGVYLTDCTRIEASVYPLKIAARLELQKGTLQLTLEDLPTHDNATALCASRLPCGALHIGDLGFFDLERFAQWAQEGVEWVTRYKIGTCLYTADEQPVVLETLLAQASATCELNVRVGRQQRLPMRLVAQRVSDSIYQKRLRRLREIARRKQQPLSQRQMVLAHWTIYLTSVLDLTFAQVHILIRARWQIERLFKRWKSLGQLASASSRDPHRRACEVFAKLFAVLIAHWLTQLRAWSDPLVSYDKFFRALQHHAALFYIACFRTPTLLASFDLLLDLLQASATLSRRKSHPNAIQLWQHFDALA
jgi:hypothetical protein